MEAAVVAADFDLDLHFVDLETRRSAAGSDFMSTEDPTARVGTFHVCLFLQASKPKHIHLVTASLVWSM
jgi:hypothetical protein